MSNTKQLLTQISHPDNRDYIPSTVNEFQSELPKTFTQSIKQPVMCQYFSYTCVAHAIVTMLQYCEARLGYYTSNYSRGFIYANRNSENTNINGMYPRKALKILLKEGVCSYYRFRWGQSQLERIMDKFYPIEKPLEEEASKNKPITSYYRLNGINEIKTAVYNNGAAIISIPMFKLSLLKRKFKPHKSYDKKVGNHCVAVIGWDGDYLICQDSYSPLRGKKGLFYVHKDYLINEAWSVIIDTSYSRPRITVTNKEKYFGYIKYITEWFFGGIKLFISNLFSRNK